GSGGLRARLVRTASDADDPFVVVHAGRFARILLAELVGADGSSLTRFAWKVRVDTSDAPGRQAPTNAELDRIWQQERAELLRVHSPNVVAPVAVPPALTQSPPVFFCRRTDSYFHPVAPNTGGLLTVCRDDARLAAAGLPSYGSDTVRYLYDASADASSATLYRVAGEPSGAGETRIETKAELIRGWSQIAHGEQPSPDLPCQTCEHRSECYAGGEGRVIAEQHLHSVSFYDVDSLAIELAATDFDTAVMRLSGGLPDEARARSWVHGSNSRLRVLEVLRLKLAAFADVCRGVGALHAGGRPHLGVSPQNIVAFEGAGGSALPSNWRLRFALTDLGGATPVCVPGVDGVETLWQPGREVSEGEISQLFLSPSLRSLEGGTVTMSVACRSVPDEATGARDIIDVHRAGVPPFVCPGDVLLVQPVAGGVVVSARVEEVGARGLTAAILPVAAGLGEGATQPSWAGTTFEARLSFVRRSGPNADLYALGMLLLRMLLVHDEQQLPEVAAAVERCLLQMTGMAVENDAVTPADRWQEILDGDDGEGRFASWHVMHQRSDRQQVFDAELKGTGIVPKQLWQTLMGLAGKLLLASPVSRSGEDGVGAMPMKAVLAELERVERQLHVELFERAARDEVIANVCNQRLLALRTEVGDSVSADVADMVPAGTMPAHGPGAPGFAVAGPETAAQDASSPVAQAEGETADGSGFVLSIGRVGESTIQQHHFSQNRVTIGRREGDNLLVLADAMVSSKHAVIEFSDGEFVLFDCGSTNGTEVDGIRLPIEVPHPLDDGSVIHIRPFMLSFRSGVAEPIQNGAVPLVSVDEVRGKLSRVYADVADRGEQEVQVELLTALDGLRASLGRRGLQASLEEMAKQAAPSAAVPSPEEPVAPVVASQPEDPVASAALRAVRQVARSLTDNPQVESEAQIQEFVGRLQRFVDVTSHWIEVMLEWRRVFSKQLDLRVTHAGAVRPPLRTAAEVCEELLAPTGDPDGAASSDYFLSRFYEDVLAILEGLLQGNQRVRNAVRERLDPARLVADASKEAKLGLLVKTAAGSALWKLYSAAFEEVTAGQGYEDELARLLDFAAKRRVRRS
ncbi:MAG: putative component of type VI protein secretion system, partial [Planctomycetota bacterium]